MLLEASSPIEPWYTLHAAFCLLPSCLRLVVARPAGECLLIAIKRAICARAVACFLNNVSSRSLSGWARIITRFWA